MIIPHFRPFTFFDFRPFRGLFFEYSDCSIDFKMLISYFWAPFFILILVKKRYKKILKVPILINKYGHLI